MLQKSRSKIWCGSIHLSPSQLYGFYNNVTKAYANGLLYPFSVLNNKRLDQTGFRLPKNWGRGGGCFTYFNRRALLYAQLRGALVCCCFSQWKGTSENPIGFVCSTAVYVMDRRAMYPQLIPQARPPQGVRGEVVSPSPMERGEGKICIVREKRSPPDGTQGGTIIISTYYDPGPQHTRSTRPRVS